MGRTLLERAGTVLYVVQPNDTMFENVKDIPNYENEAIPFLLIMSAIEMLILWGQGKAMRINESLSSMCVGVLHEATAFISRWGMFIGYESLYQYRMFDLHWNSLSTWIGAFILVDLAYYWVHRANHEINIFWAAHQLHHSSEEYNLTVPMRISLFQRAAYIGFYQSLALLGFPLPSVVVHASFNYIFQYWVHTQLIKTLGPLEYIFNTPSHHRVHHGANKWCLDKNYGSVFIIWDRMFGTFQAEKDDEPIVYGLTDQPQTVNIVWHEFYYLGIIYRKFKSMTSWSDSLKAVFYGPGWNPGTGRLGDLDAIPDITAPRTKYDPQIAMWKKMYTTVHVVMAFFVQQHLLALLPTASWMTVLAYLTFLFVTIGVIGGIYDGNNWAGFLETLRCAALITYSSSAPITTNPAIDITVVTFFSVSMMIWAMHSMADLKSSFKFLKVE